MESELKPCPFCGGSAALVNYENFVKCGKCEVETDLFETEAEAIEAWNTRQADTTLERVKELREKIATRRKWGALHAIGEQSKENQAWYESQRDTAADILAWVDELLEGQSDATQEASSKETG